MAIDRQEWGPQPNVLSGHMLAELRGGGRGGPSHEDSASFGWRDAASLLIMMGIIFAMTLGALHFWPKPRAEMPRPDPTAWMGAAHAPRYRETRIQSGADASPARQKAASSASEAAASPPPEPASDIVIQ